MERPLLSRLRGFRRQDNENSETTYLSVKKQPLTRPGERHTEKMHWTLRCSIPRSGDPQVQKVREAWAQKKGIVVPEEDTKYEVVKCELFEDIAMTRNPLTVLFDQFGGEIAIIPGNDAEDMDVVVDDVALYDVLPGLRRSPNTARAGFAKKVEIGYELGKIIQTRDSEFYIPRSGKRHAST